MDESAIREALGDEAGTGILLDGWAASQSALPPGRPFFLEPRFVASAAEDSGLSPEFAQALASAARRLDGNPATRALSWHVYYRLFRAPECQDSQLQRWPEPIAMLGEDTGLLYALALYGGLPAMHALYGTRGVPLQVARDTLHDVQRWADHYRRHSGAWGISPLSLPWLRLHLRGDLYALGRLQFQPGTWNSPVRAFRHRASGRVLTVSEDGVRYRPDGRPVWEDDAACPEDSWAARFSVGAVCIVAHRILPEGRIVREEIRLPRAEWAPVLKSGDPVLHLHIPHGKRLDPAACRQSLEEALAFFPSHFPDRPFVAFACESWLLDAQLEALLPASSNIVRFLRQLYLVPSTGNPESALEWVFDGMLANLAHAPRDTTLRRAVLDHLAAGGTLRGAGGFVLPEDVPGWGADVYRRG